jgi:hypothetical protein
MLRTRLCPICQLQTAAFVVTAILVGCGKPAPVQNADDGGCPGRPTDVVLTDTDLKLAGVKVGKAAVGTFDFKDNSKLTTFRRKNDAPRRGDFTAAAGIPCTIVPGLIA